MRVTGKFHRQSYWFLLSLLSLVSAANLSTMLFLNGPCLPAKRNWPRRRRDWPPKVTGLRQQTGIEDLSPRSGHCVLACSSPALRPLMLLSALRPPMLFGALRLVFFARPRTPDPRPGSYQGLLSLICRAYKSKML